MNRVGVFQVVYVRHYGIFSPGYRLETHAPLNPRRTPAFRINSISQHRTSSVFVGSVQIYDAVRSQKHDA